MENMIVGRRVDATTLSENGVRVKDATPKAAIAFFTESARRYHSWTLDTNREAFEADLCDVGVISSFIRANERRIAAERARAIADGATDGTDLWVGILAPDDPEAPLSGASTGESWWIDGKGRAHLAVRRKVVCGRELSHWDEAGRAHYAPVPDGTEAIVAYTVDDALVAATLEGGWIFERGAVRRDPKMVAFAVPGNPRHRVPADVALLVDGAIRAERCRR